MIRFSTRGEYGVRMMMDLARHYGKGPESLTEVARNEGLPAPYLEQLVGKLRKAGLVTSHQGAHGGYELTRPPSQITMGDVLRVLEGPISPMVCATEGETEELCDRQSFCSANLVWERVRDSVAQALDSLTLADLVPPRGQGHATETESIIHLHPIAKPVTHQGRNAAKA
ncbi:MAG TPA: Rrf2 family transcriptional regulator [Chloroflexota bacterium]